MDRSRFDPLLKRLLCFRAGSCFNPWTDHSMDDAKSNGPDARCERLIAHLSSEEPKFCLLGEAPGYQGCRVTGIPFTSEALVVSGSVPRVSAADGSLSRRTPPWAEPTARIVWRVLHNVGVAESTLLWNAFPLHPFSGSDPLSNRMPSQSEFDSGVGVLQEFLQLFPETLVICVGAHACESMKRLGRRSIRVRHPSDGGTALFERSIGEVVSGTCGALATG